MEDYHIMKKVVDKSVLYQGLSIKTAFQDILYRKMGIELKRGESVRIKILLDGIEYDAVLRNQKFDENKFSEHRADILQIRYDGNRELINAIRAHFSATWNSMQDYEAFTGNVKGFKVAKGEEEYISLFATPVKGALCFECISSSEYNEGLRLIKNMSELTFETAVDDTAGVDNVFGLKKIRHLYKGIGNSLKEKYKYRCQICGEFIGEKYGSTLIHAHHIDYFTRSLNNDSSNIMILCPNHHSIIHDCNPIFDWDAKTFTYPNGYTEGLKLNEHVIKHGK